MWIICAGAKRSGSTLQYNILARLVEETNTGIRITHFTEDEFDQIKTQYQGFDGFKVIKTHLLYPGIKNEINAGNAKVFHSFRDIRDVAVSYLNKGWIKDTEAGVQNCVYGYLKDYNSWMDLDQSIISRKYEDFVFNIVDEVEYYASVLNIKISNELPSKISDELNLEKLKSSQDHLDSSKLRTNHNNKFHADTLLHVNHIHNGSVNQFQESLDQFRIALIESVAYDYLLSHEYELAWPKINQFISYSQHADDYLAWQILSKKRDGVVVEVGAFDGKHLSNSYSLEQLGWTSVCIEPNPVIYDFLSKNRPMSHNFNCAVVGDETISEIDFYAEEIGVLSGCDYDEADIKRRYENRGLEYKAPEKIKVKARTLTSILKEIKLGTNRIDLISIDVEGFELEVLKGIDKDTFDIGLFIIEANTPKEIKEISDFFRNWKEFVHIGSNKQNMFLLNKNWTNKEALLSLDFENYHQAKQNHPIDEKLTLSSVPPKFKKSKDFKKAYKKFKLF